MSPDEAHGRILLLLTRGEKVTPTEATTLLDAVMRPLSGADRMRRLRAKRDENVTRDETVTSQNKKTNNINNSDENVTLRNRHSAKNRSYKEEEKRKEIDSKTAPTATPPVRRQEPPPGIQLNSKGEPRVGYDAAGNFIDPKGRFRWSNDYIKSLEEMYPGYKVRGQITTFATDPKLYGNSPKHRVEGYIVDKLKRSWVEREAKIKSVKAQHEAEVKADQEATLSHQELRFRRAQEELAARAVRDAKFNANGARIRN